MADIAATPNGGTLCLQAAGTYRLDGRLHIANRNGLTIEGNGAQVRRVSESSLNLIQIDQCGNDITLRNFTVDGGSSQPGVWRSSLEAGHAVRVGGAIRVSLDGMTLRNVTGDGLYLAGGCSPFRPADSITMRDSIIDGTGRNGVSITDGGNNVVIAGNTFRNIGYYTFDIEPNGHDELGLPGAIGVDFVDNQLGPQAYAYHDAVHGFVMAITGSSGGGPAIDIDYSRNTLTGQPFRVGVYNNGGARQDIRVADNVSDTPNTGQVMLPLLFFGGVDGLTVTNNVGFTNAEVSTSGSTNVVISGNQTAAVANVSGILIPPPFPGYERVHFTEFPNNQALGQNPHPDTAQYLTGRPDIARDCTFNDSSGRGRYCWKATTSEHDGVLDQWLHTETGSCKTSGFTHQHNGSGGCNYVSGPKWTLPDQDEFVISYVARFEDIPGRKLAYLRWCGPKVGDPGYCEDDFVEAKLESGPRGNAFHHHESRTTKQGAQLNIELDEWHLYQMHVKPCQFVDFYVDGELRLHATQFVTCDSSYWVFQSETYLKGQSIPEPDNQGHLLLDAYAVDLPN